MCCLDRQVILIAIFCIKIVLFHKSYGHMNIGELSIVIISKRYSQNLPYSTFLICWVYRYKRFASFRGSLSSLWLITCWKHHIALFSLYEFFLWVSHIKFLMRQYRHKTMSYHLFFPKRFLVDDIETYDTLYSFLYVSFSFLRFLI